MASRVNDWFSRRWPSLLSALLMTLAFPPFNYWPFIFISIVPHLWRLKTFSNKEAWKSGYLYGFVFFLGQALWLFRLAEHWTHNPTLSIIPWVLGSAYVALYFGLVSLLIRCCLVRNWIGLIPIVWAGVEVLRSYVPVLSFPWGLSATPLFRTPLLIQSAHFGTIFLVSAWVVLLNLMLVLIIDPQDRPKIRPLMVAFLLILGLSGIQYVSKSETEPFPVTIGQPGVDMAFGDEYLAPIEAARNIDGFTASALTDGSKLMVLPEGTVRGTDFPPRPLFELTPKLPVLFGGQHGENPTYQTAFGYDGDWHFADKTRLVVFGEYIPGRSSIPFIAKAFDLPTKDLTPSPNGVRSVDVGGIRVGPMLCFEGLFPEVSYQQARNGAKIIAVMCIDDWYMGTTAPEQLEAGSIFRAVETGLPLVRSASLGYTIAVDAHGNIVGEVPLKEPGAIRIDMQIPKSSPLFPLLPVFPVLALLSVGIVPVSSLVNKRKTPASP